MQDSLKKFSPAVFGIALICFVLPWANFSCQGERILSLTGLQLVTGATVERQSTLGRSLLERRMRERQQEVENGRMTQQQADRAANEAPRTDPQPFAIAVLILTIFGVVLSFLKSRKSALMSTVIGIAGFASLMILRSKLEADASSQAQGMVQTEFAVGFWAVLVLLAVAIVLNGYLYSRSPKQLQSSPPQT